MGCRWKESNSEVASLVLLQLQLKARPAVLRRLGFAPSNFQGQWPIFSYYRTYFSD
jgi:hypothetical protein